MIFDRASPRSASGPCWYCAHYAGACWGDPDLADCRQGGGKSCKATASGGCAFFERLPGVDDDHWAPPMKTFEPMKKPGSVSGIGATA